MKIGRMNFKAALRTTVTAGAFLLIPGCGGDGGPLPVANSNVGIPSPPQGSGISVTPAHYVAIDLNSSAYFPTSGQGVMDGEQAGFGNLAGNSGPCSRHALLWRGSASSVVDLHPDGFCESGVLAASGGMQAGWGKRLNGVVHALKWAGSASSVVDLDPTGVTTYATGIFGDQVVGFSQTGYGYRALLWTSSGMVDLHPSRFWGSIAYATDGSQQVGRGDAHAVFWTGNAESVVDLHPGSEDCSSSEAHGVSAGQQVGFVRCGTTTRALLWTGSAQSVVDLHPSGFRSTWAIAVAAGRQVGWGETADGLVHALLWNGNADSVVDLHVFLPAGFHYSEASGIDGSGNVVGTADGHTILWVRQ